MNDRRPLSNSPSELPRLSSAAVRGSWRVDVDVVNRRGPRMRGLTILGGGSESPRNSSTGPAFPRAFHHRAEAHLRA